MKKSISLEDQHKSVKSLQKLLAFSDTTTILPDKNIRPLATADRKKNPISTGLDMFRLVWKRIFFGENMILPSMQNPVYQDQQENSKMEKKIQKSRIFQRICLGFLPASFEKKIQNPQTPSIDLKRKQEEKKTCFQRFILILI